MKTGSCVFPYFLISRQGAGRGSTWKSRLVGPQASVGNEARASDARPEGLDAVRPWGPTWPLQEAAGTIRACPGLSRLSRLTPRLRDAGVHLPSLPIQGALSVHKAVFRIECPLRTSWAGPSPVASCESPPCRAILWFSSSGHAQPARPALQGPTNWTLSHSGINWSQPPPRKKGNKDISPEFS